MATLQGAVSDLMGKLDLLSRTETGSKQAPDCSTSSSTSAAHCGGASSGDVGDDEEECS